MWSKFDDQFYLNPKNAAIDRDEQDLHIAAIIYCNGQLTDGFIPGGVIPLLCAWAKLGDGVANAMAIAKHLVEHDYWEIAEGGFQIHDFLDWNLSREEVLARREARSDAGRRGGQIKQANAIASAKQVLKQMPGKNVPSTSTSTLINTTTTGAEERPNIYRVYEVEIGPLTPFISDVLNDLVEKYPQEWVEAAIRESAINGVRKPNYIKKILERWQTDGFKSLNKPKPGVNGNSNGHKPRVQVDDAVQKMLDEVRNGKAK